MHHLKNWLLLGLCVSVLAVTFTSHAQERSYRLIEPDADDYLAVVDAVIANAETYYSFNSFDGGSGKAEWDSLADEIGWRLIDRETITYQQLLTIYRAFAAGQNAGETDTDDQMIPPLIELWLAENPTELRLTTSLAFDGFVFDVRSFNNSPGISLHLIEAPLGSQPLYHEGFSEHVADFILIETEPMHYRIPLLPTPMFGHVKFVGDFNDDKQPDFAYLNYDHLGNSYVSGALRLVTWTGTAFENLGSLGFRHGLGQAIDLNWNILNVDEDDQQEAYMSRLYSDNWGCAFVRFTFYDWQADGTLAPEVAHDNPPHSFDCQLRQAEELMWQGQYVDAIPLYEQVLMDVEEPSRARTYAQMKLGFAYLLNNQTDEARTAFSRLIAPIDDTETAVWVDDIRAAYEADPRLLPMCQALYQSALDILDPYGVTGEVEVYEGGFNRFDAGMAPPFDPENLSCDLQLMLSVELLEMNFSLPETPVNQLEALGLSVADAIIGDFDTDGDADWLVWVAGLGLDPLLFVANEDTYALSVLEGMGKGGYLFPERDLRLPDEAMTYQMVMLPDGQFALAQLDFGTDEYTSIRCNGVCGGGGPDRSCAAYGPDTGERLQIGDLSLWRLDGDQLTPIFFTQTCSWGGDANAFLADSAEVVNQFVAGAVFSPEEWVEETRPVLYSWDSTNGTFVEPVRPPTPTPVTPTVAPVSEATSVPAQQYSLDLYTFLSVRTDFAQHDFEAALVTIDGALNQSERVNESFRTAFHYSRALTLEVLGRTDEALAEYVAMYEVAPTTAWGVLAALHFEKIE